MRRIAGGILLIVSAGFGSCAMAKGGGTLATPCTGTPPAQATSASLTNLALCEAFTTNQHVDVNATQSPGYNWYTQSINSTQSVTPSGNITNDGTGLSISGSGPVNNGQALVTMGHSSTAPYWVGTPVYGSFYAELDMKFNPIVPSGQANGDVPAFWLVNNYISHGVNAPTINPSDFPYTEVDVFEATANNGVGNPIQPNLQIDQWIDNAGSQQLGCTSNGYPSITGSYTYSNYNTYGLLYLTPSDNGGTGLLKWYINNTLQGSCTYSTGGYLSCTYGQSNCSIGAFSNMATSPTTFLIGTGKPTWANTVRNFHVWQK